MTKDGGGWTLILGAGTKFGYTSEFWNGNMSSNINSSFGDYNFSSEISQKLLKNLLFKDIRIDISESIKVIFTSDNKTTFISKKDNLSP